jgi:outer membrane protein assembly factor BamB
MRRPVEWLALVSILCALVHPAHAVTARSWSASTEAEFARGTLDGTALDQDGRVGLAPELSTLWGPEQGIVWAVQPAGSDAAFVALSGPGKVLRVREGRDPETWFEAVEETLVTAMVANGSDEVLFGLSPDGTVMRARAGDGSEIDVETLVETDALFIWSMLRRPDGALWIGTGVPGKLLRLGPDGEIETVFDAGEDPVRAMAPLPGGGVVIGTGGQGRVVRIDPDDRAFVLLDADETEIVSIAAADDGGIYALATDGAKQPSPQKPSPSAAAQGAGAVHVVVTPPPDERESQRETPERRPKAQPKRPQTFKTQPGGGLYRIDADGTTRRIWETTQDMPFAVVPGASGTLLVGTGDSGRVHALDRDGRSARLLRIPSNQVSAMAIDAAGRVLLGGTTDARLEILGAGPRSEGSYLSPAVDAGSVADWGRLLWDAALPRGASLRVQVRSGNTSEPDDTWSPWVDLGSAGSDSAAETTVPAARWFQARFELSAARGDSPLLRRIEIAYQARNRPPAVTGMTVEAPGVVWLRGPTQSSFQVGPLVADDPIARKVSTSLRRGGRAARATGTIRKTYEAGARTFSWTAEDPDGDRLRYSLAIRQDGAEEWFPLAVDLGEGFHSWDARAMPDGVYRVRLTVDDSLDNPNGTHRHSERISDAFRVDNTRPSVGDHEVERSDEGYGVRFVARDPGGSVAAVEVAIDGGEWKPLSPLDGVADSELESYRLIVQRNGENPAGARSMIVRVTDSSGNLGGAMWRID